MPSPVPLSAFAMNIFSTVQADICERVNLLLFVKLVPTFSNRPKYRRATSRLRHGPLAALASDSPKIDRLGELRDNFPEHYDVVFLVAVRRIFELPTSCILSNLCSTTACASCHLSDQDMRGAYELAGVDISNYAWATAFADRLAQCGGYASVHIARS
jgi:hypothetical protein